MTMTCWIAPGGRIERPGGCWPGELADAAGAVIATTAATDVERASKEERRNGHLRVRDGQAITRSQSAFSVARLRSKWVTVLYLLGMNLQQLRYLVTAADAESLSAAARTLQISQPVLSRALHGLERECRVALFRREGRRLVLTEAGTAVATAARRALDAVDDVHRTARQLALGSELVLVSTPTNSTLLSGIVASFIKSRPSVALRLRRASDMEEVIRMVTHHEADLGFGDIAGRDEPAPVHFEPLWAVDVVVVSPAGSDLPPTVPVARLGDLQLVLPPKGSERRTMIDDLVVEAGGQQPSASFATDERSAWIASAQGGVASFLSYQAVAVDLEGVELRPLDPPLDTVVGFVHRQSDLSAEGCELVRQAHACAAPVGCAPIGST
jgi:DNA-binding transcriptional LysR family regulator